MTVQHYCHPRLRDIIGAIITIKVYWPLMNRICWYYVKHDQNYYFWIVLKTKVYSEMMTNVYCCWKTTGSVQFVNDRLTEMMFNSAEHMIREDEDRWQTAIANRH